MPSVRGATIVRIRWDDEGPQNPSEFDDRDAMKRSAAAPVGGSNRGPQLDFPAQQFQGVAEVWVPFEEAIVIGWR